MARKGAADFQPPNVRRAKAPDSSAVSRRAIESGASRAGWFGGWKRAAPLRARWKDGLSRSVSLAADVRASRRGGILRDAGKAIAILHPFFKNRVEVLENNRAHALDCSPAVGGQFRKILLNGGSRGRGRAGGRGRFPALAPLSITPLRALRVLRAIEDTLAIALSITPLRALRG